MAELVIKGGTVIDGTGAPGVVSDVAIDNGRITAIGPDLDGAHTVDAAGLVVAPGFVDLHTHYDAQLSWDPTASPSPLHGVTTGFGGNCGFSIAPAGAEHADYLMRMMARVEGMPLAALEQGLAWDWSSFGEWMDRLDGNIGINAGFLCGHSALRRVVMGDDAVGGVATEKQLDDITRLLRESLAAGAVGFSTSTAPTHNDGGGHPVPSRSASSEEFRRLAAALRDYPGTTIELIFAGCLNGFTDDEVALMTDMSVAANRPINWNVLGVSALNPTGHESQLSASDRAAEGGGRIVALTLPSPPRIRLSFLTGFVLEGFPGWRETLTLPIPQRMAALADPAVRARLAAGASSDDAGVLRALSNWKILELSEIFAPEYKAYEGQTVGQAAAALGREPFDALLDIVLADELRTGIRPPAFGNTDEDWQVRTKVWQDPRAIIGGSDAGAHLDMMCGAIYSTAVLAGVREKGGITLETAIRLLSDVPARFYGVRERGRLQPGWHADVIVFDPAMVGHGGERTVDDLPGSASRVYADGVGFERVYVNGVAVVERDRLTGALPGTLLRSGRDTETVTP